MGRCVFLSLSFGYGSFVDTDTGLHCGIAYYNAGSAALVLLLIAISVGAFFWWRRYRSRRAGLLKSPHAGAASLEESIPLTQSRGDSHYRDVDAEREGLGSREDVEMRSGSRKGKERATEASPVPQETIFRVDDDSDEEGHGR